MNDLHRYPKILIRILSIIMFSLLFGCSTQADNGSNDLVQSDTVATQISSAITHPATPAATDTPLPTATNTPSSSATPLPASLCPARETDLQSGFLSSGTIVFIEYGWVVEPDYLYRLSSTDMELQPFMDDLEPGIFGYFRVSPDGKWLTFSQSRWEDAEQRDAYDLILTTSNESERKIIPWDEENWGHHIYDWIADGQRLAISPNYSYEYTWLNEVVLFKPFTGQQQRMELPVEDSGWWGIVGSSVIYDPTLTRAVYLERESDLVLWDVENERELWRFVQPNLMGHQVPTWSPDGKYLVFVDMLEGEEDDYWPTTESEFQVLMVNRNGDEIWRSDILSKTKDGGWDVLMNSFTWSPDGRYLAYTWLTPEDEGRRTYLLDTTSWKVLDYCIGGLPPIWSTDSKQIIVWEKLQAQSPNLKGPHRIVVVDVEKRIIVQLDDITFRPVAWILNEP